MKHCKAVEFLSIFKMSNNLHKRKAPYWRLSADGSDDIAKSMLGLIGLNIGYNLHYYGNRNHAPVSLYYCLFAPRIYIVVLRVQPVRGESHNQRNANGEVATQYYSIKSLTNQTWRKCGMNNMAVRNSNGRFSKLIREVHKNAGIY